MQIKGCDARRVGVYKGRELPNKPPPPQKKDQEKEIRTTRGRRKRERTMCVLA